MVSRTMTRLHPVDVGLRVGMLACNVRLRLLLLLSVIDPLVRCPYFLPVLVVGSMRSIQRSHLPCSNLHLLLLPLLLSLSR